MEGLVLSKERIIVALDVDSRQRALELVELLKDEVGMFKVGMQLFYSLGPGIVTEIAGLGGKVFLDLKMHDIPNTVAAGARSLTRLGCAMFNVHAAGGFHMLKAAAEAAKNEAEKLGVEKPKLLAVTVLTSLSPIEVEKEMLSRLPLPELVRSWAAMAKEAGLDGVVASYHEVDLVRDACGKDFLVVTPGVRPAWSGTDDQKRVATPFEALKAGADYLVIGRPITNAQDPKEAARRIAQELEGPRVD